MGKKRTPLGTELFIVLIAQLVEVAILGVVLLIGVSAMSKYGGIYSPAFSGIMYVTTFVVVGVVALIYWTYFNAFKKNDPQRIRTLTIVLLVIMLIALVLSLLFFNVLKDPGFAKMYNIENMNIDYSQLIVTGILGISVLGITLYELNKHRAGNITASDKRLWLIVLAIEAYFFLTGLFGLGTGRSVNAVGAITTFINAACQTLIAYWITNPEKFYVDENQGVVPPAVNEDRFVNQ